MKIFGVIFVQNIYFFAVICSTPAILLELLDHGVHDVVHGKRLGIINVVTIGFGHFESESKVALGQIDVVGRRADDELDGSGVYVGDGLVFHPFSAEDGCTGRWRVNGEMKSCRAIYAKMSRRRRGRRRLRAPPFCFVILRLRLDLVVAEILDFFGSRRDKTLQTGQRIGFHSP